MSDTKPPQPPAWRRGAAVLALLAYTALCFRAAASTDPDRLDALVAAAPLAVVVYALCRRVAPAFSAVATGLLTVCGTLALLPILLRHTAWLLVVQHAGTYGAASLLFLRSLRAQQVPLVTTLAGLGRPVLPPSVRRYTRAVTWAWGLWLAAIAAGSVLVYALFPGTPWATYSTVVSPALLLALALAEYAVRCQLIPGADRGSLADTVRAMRHTWTRTP